MDIVLNSLFSLLLIYKYSALFFIGFFGALVLPLPASTTLMIASAFASAGYLNFYWVIVTTFLANVFGDNIGYWLSRFYGAEVLHRIGFARVLKSKAFLKIEKYVVSYSRLAVFFTRFLTEFGPSVNVLAGLGKMPYRTFLTYDLLGEGLYVLIFSLLGYFFGDNWKYIADLLGQASVVLIIAIVLIFFVRLKFFKKKTA